MTADVRHAPAVGMTLLRHLELQYRAQKLNSPTIKDPTRGWQICVTFFTDTITDNASLIILFHNFIIKFVHFIYYSMKKMFFFIFHFFVFAQITEELLARLQ